MMFTGTVIVIIVVSCCNLTKNKTVRNIVFKRSRHVHRAFNAHILLLRTYSAKFHSLNLKIFFQIANDEMYSDEEAEDDDDMVSLKRNSSFLRDRKKQF